MSFEYKIIEIPVPPIELEDKLNDLGAEGWEFSYGFIQSKVVNHAITGSQKVEMSFYIILKRCQA